MTHSLINPADPPQLQTAKLLKIADVLMRRVEQSTDDSGAAYAQFQRAVMLEDQVRRIFADCSPFRLPADLYDTDHGGWKETTLSYRVRK